MKISLFLKAGGLAGLIAAGLNILIYIGLVLFGGHQWEFLIVISILIASLLPNLLAGLAYFGVYRLDKWAVPILTIGVTAFVLISILPHFGIGPAPSPALSMLPAGFDRITVPLHIVFGLSAILIMPRLVVKMSEGKSGA